MIRLKMSHGKLDKHLGCFWAKSALQRLAACGMQPCAQARLGGHVFALPFARRASQAAP
ncbi:hypothetical protein A2U01_0117739, partial [Trifolium medium]|nr:hypothetical protein [Trifolium medium]